MNNTFNPSRALKLIINDLRSYKKTILISAIVLLMFFSIFSYFFVLYAGGLVLTSMAFNDLHDRQKGQALLMIPCSNFEKFLSKWFLSSIGYIVATSFIYGLFLLIKEGSISFAPYFFEIELPKYFILHSMVLLGAITFKKYALIKVSLVIGIISILIAGIYMSLIAIFKNELFYPEFFNPLFDGMFYKRLNFLWALIPPLFWYVTYLRLTEYEMN